MILKHFPLVINFVVASITSDKKFFLLLLCKDQSPIVVCEIKKNINYEMQTKFIEQELFFYNTSERLYWVMIIKTYLQLCLISSK